jgi:murein L,D-transpeptidase YafK
MRLTLYVTSILLLWSNSVLSANVDNVLVVKSTRTMYLLSKGNKVKTYSIALGRNPVGHKQQKGDERTPEGKYSLDYKNSESSFHKAIHISYPNENDTIMAKEKGVEPGGFIMIHGQKNGYGWLSWLTQKINWTNGCIAVTDEEMDEIWRLVKIGTPIEIQP